ncbi:MFS transporter [Gorillibacterium timonense]|uniref:MFS transporter n=1 Tax=Gorillibacterium timonense TaxID=1689269 RepID=UPI00131E2F91|nr:MFS transporter [Gorillibacterium timonense]
MKEEGREKRSVLLLVFLIPFLMGLGIDLYAPSLPMLTQHYHSDPGSIRLTIGLYMLGYGLGQIGLGIASDGFGRRRIMVASSLCYAYGKLLVWGLVRDFGCAGHFLGQRAA